MPREKTPSTQKVIRVPLALFQECKDAAARMGIDLNAWIKIAMGEKITREWTRS